MPEKNDEAVHIDEAGKGELDDEMLPNRGEPVPQEDAGGDEPDPGAPEGAVETAAALERRVDEERS